MKKLDSKDQKILSLLRENARLSIVEIAKKIDVTRATAQSRIDKLEAAGVILGYTVKIRSDADRPNVRAQISIQAESKKEAKIIRSLRGNPHVTAVHHTTGKWDLIAELHAEDLASFNTVIGELRLIDGVIQTETNLLLDTYE